jgi:hypothetical protein
LPAGFVVLQVSGQECPLHILLRFYINLLAQVHDVDVGTEADVVGEVPPVVVGIVVDHDVVIVPVPVIAITGVEGGDAEIVSAKPEAVRTTAPETPDVTAPDGQRKVAVFPRMVEVKAGVLVSVIVAHPAVVSMNVRSFGVAGFVAEGLVLFWMLLLRMFGGGRVRFRLRSALHGAVIRLRAVAGNIASAHGRSSASAVIFMLSYSG